MNESFKMDDIDKACINALLENPRGSWRELSLASEIPEKNYPGALASFLMSKSFVP